LLTDTSALVRGAAVWALSQLISKQRLAELAAKRRSKETDPGVEEEWVQALAQ
jgi:epoxyqueuosine reductase